MRRLAWAFAALAVAAVIGPKPSQAYYYFVHSVKGGSVPEKFDLTALQNNTVSFFVSENGPTTYAPYDTFNSVLGQIQQAVAIWNGVGSSSLRVSFGGMENAATLQNTPGGDVDFEDLPPGVEGFGGPTSVVNPATAADGTQFYPIVRSVVHLSLNLNQNPGPSYDQSFLMTVLHEMGHAMGLQHTFTSATMSQATTRATTMAHPLGTDDVAGLSVLYPTANFSQQFGSISGTITAGGQGVAMASVVAIQVGADAVSAVTNADGSYQIDGIPPGQYAIYVHTMPPDADIYGPDGNQVTAFQAVDSLFYPAATNFTQATPVTVTAGKVTGGINIQTNTRASIPLYDGSVYGYFGDDGISPAAVQISTNPTAVAAAIVGLGTNEPVSGLGVQVPGGAVSIYRIAAQPYTAANGQSYTAADIDLTVSANAQPGQEHMIFTAPDYMYVLPSAMYLTLTPPPTISGMTNNGDGTLTLTGTNWTAATLLYFDSLPATVTSLNPAAGTAIVVPPAGVNGQVSTLTAYNPDGQNSQMLQSESLCILPGLPGCPVTYLYGSRPTPTITAISPSSLPAGADAMVDITGSGFSFAQSAASIGFGTSDVLVQQIYVLSPNHVQVDVSVAPGAALSTSDVTAISGFQFATAPAAFQIAAATPGLPAPYPVLFNGLPGLTGSYAGAIVSLYGANLAAPNAAPTVTIGGKPATLLYSSASQINLVIPPNLPPGPAPMIVNNGVLSDTVVVNITAPPAGIAAIQTSTGAYIDSSSPAYQGEMLIVTLTGVPNAPGNVQVSVGGVSHNATQVNAVQVGSVVYYQVFFQLNANDPVGAAEPLIVYLDGLSSVPATIQVLPAPAASQ